MAVRASAAARPPKRAARDLVPRSMKGGRYWTARLRAPACATDPLQRCAKLQHFRDGSRCGYPAGLLPSCACDGREDVIARAARQVAPSALLIGLLLAGLSGPRLRAPVPTTSVRSARRPGRARPAGSALTQLRNARTAPTRRRTRSCGTSSNSSASTGRRSASPAGTSVARSGRSSSGSSRSTRRTSSSRRSPSSSAPAVSTTSSPGSRP